MKISPNIGLNIPEGNDVFDYEKFLKDNLTKIDENIVKIPTSEEFVATEGQTVFNLSSSYAVGENVLSVEVDGVPQDLGTGFLETSETSITLTEGVPAGAIISVTTFNLPKGVNTQLATITSQLADIATVFFKGQGTDDTTAFQNAVNQAGVNGVVWTSGKIHLKAGINVPDGLTFMGDGQFYNDYPNGSGSGGHSAGSTLNSLGIVALSQKGSTGASYTVTDTTVSSGLKTLTIGTHALVAGDYVYVQTEGLANSYDRRREIANIQSVTSTTITLQVPLHFTYTGTVKVYKLTLGKGFYIAPTVKLEGVGVYGELTKSIKVNSKHKGSFISILRSVEYDISPISFDGNSSPARIDVFASSGYGNIEVKQAKNINIASDNALIKLNQTIETKVKVSNLFGGKLGGYAVMVDTNYAEDADGFTDIPCHSLDVDLGTISGFPFAFLAICDPTRGQIYNLNVKGTVSDGEVRAKGVEGGLIDVLAPNSLLTLEGNKDLEIRGKYRTQAMNYAISSVGRPNVNNERIKFMGTTYTPLAADDINFKTTTDIALMGVTLDARKTNDSKFAISVWSEITNINIVGLVYIPKPSLPATYWGYKAGTLTGEKNIIGASSSLHNLLT